jgi:hypothetical protein
MKGIIISYLKRDVPVETVINTFSKNRFGIIRSYEDLKQFVSIM